MKKFLIIFFVLFSISSFSQEWLLDRDLAFSSAKKEGKNILILFSGSDWCGPCIMLEKMVWETDEFENYSKDIILLKIDFPRKNKNRLSDEQFRHNQQVSMEYNPRGSVPMVVLVSPENKVLGVTGYYRTTVDEYLSNLDDIQKNSH